MGEGAELCGLGSGCDTETAAAKRQNSHFVLGCSKTIPIGTHT